VTYPPRTAGTCAPERGRPPATSVRRASVGNAPAASPTGCRTPLCATDWRAIREGHGRFDELRQLCGLAGDKLSLAIGMTGRATELLYSGRSREGAHLGSEQMALLESIGDPTMTVGLSLLPFCNWFDSGEFGTLLQWTDTVVDLAGGDPARGAEFGFGSPLAGALVWRGVARWWLGRPGWRRDLDDAAATARGRDPTTLAAVTTWGHAAIQYGVLRADDAALRAIEAAVQTAEGSSNVAVGIITYTLGAALLSRDPATDRQRGIEAMERARDLFVSEPAPFLVPVTDVWLARERARNGDRERAVAVMRAAEEQLHRDGRMFYALWATGVLAETLLDRGADDELADAEVAIDRLATLQAGRNPAALDITLLRLRALLALARGDDASTLLRRHRATAESLGFEGQMDWAEAMAATPPVA
jgi:hypothetical protein